jgi:hypothetical protein
MGARNLLVQLMADLAGEMLSRDVGYPVHVVAGQLIANIGDKLDMHHWQIFLTISSLRGILQRIFCRR